MNRYSRILILTAVFVSVFFGTFLVSFAQGLGERELVLVRSFNTSGNLTLDRGSLGIPDDLEIVGNTINVSMLIVGGGGGGGVGESAGGGGGGQVRIVNQTLQIGTSIQYTVGQGGAGGIRSANSQELRRGQNGSPSSVRFGIFPEIVSLGGGGGGLGFNGNGNNNGNGKNGQNGGSGGGAGAAANPSGNSRENGQIGLGSSGNGIFGNSGGALTSAVI